MYCWMDPRLKYSVMSCQLFPLLRATPTDIPTLTTSVTFYPLLPALVLWCLLTLAAPQVPLLFCSNFCPIILLTFFYQIYCVPTIRQRPNLPLVKVENSGLIAAGGQVRLEGLWPLGVQPLHAHLICWILNTDRKCLFSVQLAWNHEINLKEAWALQSPSPPHWCCMSYSICAFPGCALGVGWVGG